MRISLDTLLVNELCARRDDTPIATSATAHLGVSPSLHINVDMTTADNLIARGHGNATCFDHANKIDFVLLDYNITFQELLTFISSNVLPRLLSTFRKYIGAPVPFRCTVICYCKDRYPILSRAFASASRRTRGMWNAITRCTHVDISSVSPDLAWRTIVHEVTHSLMYILTSGHNYPAAVAEGMAVAMEGHFCIEEAIELPELSADSALPASKRTSTMRKPKSLGDLLAQPDSGAPMTFDEARGMARCLVFLASLNHNLANWPAFWSRCGWNASLYLI